MSAHDVYRLLGWLLEDTIICTWARAGGGGGGRGRAEGGGVTIEFGKPTRVK